MKMPKSLMAALSIIGSLLLGLGYSTQFFGVDIVTRYIHVSWIGYFLMLLGFMVSLSPLFSILSKDKIKCVPVFVGKIQFFVVMVSVGSFFVFGVTGVRIYNRLALLLVALGIVIELVYKVTSNICSRISQHHIDAKKNNGFLLSKGQGCLCQNCYVAVKYCYAFALGVVIGGFVRSVLVAMTE